MAMGRKCAAHRHNEDVPLEIHHIWPKGDGGPDTPENRVSLCANAHGSVHDLINHGRKVGGPGALPWEVRRRYGAKVRELAAAGWVAITSQR